MGTGQVLCSATLARQNDVILNFLSRFFRKGKYVKKSSGLDVIINPAKVVTKAIEKKLKRNFSQSDALDKFSVAEFVDGKEEEVCWIPGWHAPQ